MEIKFLRRFVENVVKENLEGFFTNQETYSDGLNQNTNLISKMQYLEARLGHLEGQSKANELLKEFEEVKDSQERAYYSKGALYLVFDSEVNNILHYPHSFNEFQQLIDQRLAAKWRAGDCNKK